ncbi:FadR/GntR family transcriptional regulator [Arthrobacter sp. B1I2]|uniref:FadR/GntR family transcriptional regulator n=1 Tax=Arthrobacter sp. B1I2 TaxID=3042263 RepID=UPI0027D781FA|nr:GntR family transcriptional regulator [Arthrobacter sp. B1I2]
MVLRWIERQFLAGVVGIGDRLLPERTLADILNVSRTSVREAIRILEAMGIVRAGVGSGPDAGTVVTADPAGSINGRAAPSRRDSPPAGCRHCGNTEAFGDLVRYPFKTRFSSP